MTRNKNGSAESTQTEDLVQVDVQPAFQALASDLHLMLKAALLWASDDVTTPHLSGVRVESHNGGIRVVGTNGHGLYVGVLNATDIRGARYTLTRDTVTSLLAVTKPYTRKRAPQATVTFTGTSAVVSDTASGDVVIVPIRGTNEPFPPFEKCIPTDEPSGIPGGKIGVDANYLALVAKAFSAHHGVRLETHGGELEPMRFFGSTVEPGDAYIVLMPMRM